MRNLHWRIAVAVVVWAAGCSDGGPADAGPPDVGPSAETCRVAVEHLADNAFLQYADDSFDTLPMPDMLPKRLRIFVSPLWNVVTPIALRVPKVLGQRHTHPKMRELLDIRSTPLTRLEYAVYATASRLAWRYLPRAVVLDPLAYNRYRYERLRSGYRGVQLDSFAA